MHKPLNLALTLILFALGVGLISLLLNMNQQIEENFNKNLAGIDLVLGAKGSPLQLILCAMYHVDNPTGNINIGKAKAFLNPKHPLIKDAVPLSLGDSYRNYRIVGTTYDILEIYNAELAEGKLWANDMDVTIGATVADVLHLHVGGTFKSSHGLVEGIEEHEHDFRVVGILQPTGSVIDQLILCNTQSIWESHAVQSTVDSPQSAVGEETGHGEKGHDHSHEGVAPASYDSLSLRKMAVADRLELMEHEDKDVTAILLKYRSRTNIRALNMGRSINENTELMAASPPIEVARLQTNLGGGTKVLTQLAGVIVFVSGLSIFISLFSSLRERKYELALMRVMGGTPATLFWVILLEGLGIGCFGLCAGYCFEPPRHDGFGEFYGGLLPLFFFWFEIFGGRRVVVFGRIGGGFCGGAGACGSGEGDGYFGDVGEGVIWHKTKISDIF